MPDLAALEALLTVSRTGGLYTPTAGEFGVTQQAISALEALTGISHVVRGPRVRD
jgi:hypothetical protein